MDKLLDFIFKNIKTNVKEVFLVILGFTVFVFYKNDKDFFAIQINQLEADKIFYRHKADSLQAEYNELQDAMLKDKEEELEFLRNSNKQLDRILSER